MEPDQLYTSGSKNTEKIKKWKESLIAAEHSLKVWDEILPILNKMAIWLQLLSSISMITISKVLLALNDIKLEIAKLEDRIRILKRGRVQEGKATVLATPEMQATADEVKHIKQAFNANITHYFGAGSYFMINLQVYELAAYLDPCVLQTLPDLNKSEIFIKSFCTENEKRVQEVTAPSLFTTNRVPAALLARMSACVSQSTTTTVLIESPLEKQLSAYNMVLFGMKAEARLILDACVFWPKHRSKFPILSRIAAQIFGCQATSVDIERMFSVSGRIFSIALCNLKDVTGAALVTLKAWQQDGERQQQPQESGRSTKRVKRDKAIMTLTVHEDTLTLLNDLAADSRVEAIAYAGNEAALGDLGVSALAHAHSEDSRYDGYHKVLEKPRESPKDLKKGDRIAMHFVGFGWDDGSIIKDVDRSIKQKAKVWVFSLRRKKKDRTSTFTPRSQRMGRNGSCWRTTTRVDLSFQ